MNLLPDHVATNLIWTFAEPSVIIMAASLPFLYKLAEEITDKLQNIARRCSLRRRSQDSSEPVPLTGVETGSAGVSRESPKTINNIVTCLMGSGIVKTSEIVIVTRDRGDDDDVGDCLTFREAMWEGRGGSPRWSGATRE